MFCLYVKKNGYCVKNYSVSIIIIMTFTDAGIGNNCGHRFSILLVAGPLKETRGAGGN